MKALTKIEQDIAYLESKIYYCKVNDMLHDMEKYQIELERLKESHD
jgi:hypothetical protein